MNYTDVQLQSALVRRIIPITLLITSLFLMSTRFAQACTCDPDFTHQNLQGHTSILSGIVIAEHVFYHRNLDYDDLRDLSSTVAEYVYEIKVRSVWKGPNNSEYVYIRSGTSSRCGVSLNVGQEYVLYAASNMEVGQCGTSLLTQDVIDELGKGTPPTTGTRAPRPSIMDSSSWITEEALILELTRILRNVDPRQLPRTPFPQPSITGTPMASPAPTPTDVSTPALTLAPSAHSRAVCDAMDTPDWLIPAVAGAFVAAQIGVGAVVYTLLSRRGGT